MTFGSILDIYEARIESLLGPSEPTSGATSADMARAEAIYGHAFPDELEVLYRRHNGGLRIVDGGWGTALPGDHREALQDASWAAGVPFGFRDHVEVVRYDNAALHVALAPGHRGEVWRIAIDEVPALPMRVAPDLGTLFATWNRLLDDGVYVANFGMAKIEDGDDYAQQVQKLFDQYGMDVNPYLYTDSLWHLPDDVEATYLAACGVSTGLGPGELFDRREELNDRIEAFLAEHEWQGDRGPDARTRNLPEMQRGMMGLIADHLTAGGTRPPDPAALLGDERQLDRLNEAMESHVHNLLPDHDTDDEEDNH